jgi:hypothetical protein
MTGDRHLNDWENLLPASICTGVIASLSVSAPLGIEAGNGVFGDEGGKIIGEAVGVTLDTNIAPCTVMVDEDRRSMVVSLANCLFLGNETPAGAIVRSFTFCCCEATRTFHHTFPQSMEMLDHRQTSVRNRYTFRVSIVGGTTAWRYDRSCPG